MRRLSRRAFLIVNAALGTWALTAQWWARVGPAVAQAMGTEVPTTVPTHVGMESDPAPTPTASLTANPTMTPQPGWAAYLPIIARAQTYPAATPTDAPP